MRVITKNKQANVLLLYNYYKNCTPTEFEDSRRYAAHMVASLEAVGHNVHVAEFWKDVHTALHSYNPADWIIFNWCEGIEGEVGGDARICRTLDELGYT